MPEIITNKPLDECVEGDDATLGDVQWTIAPGGVIQKRQALIHLQNETIGELMQRRESLVAKLADVDEKIAKYNELNAG